jgi:holliday junction DNA helicase RuvB
MTDNLRPTTLAQYLGQPQVKRLVEVSIQGAKRRNQPLDNVLLNGPPGLGKTTLANIIATEMGWNLKTIVSTNMGTPRDAVMLIQQLPKRTILFIDEIHRLRGNVQETLYPVLEDGKLYSWLGPVEVPINPITIIGATTNIGKLERPFIDRFGLQFQLVYYTPEELTWIIRNSILKLKMHMTSDAMMVVAKRSRGTPRLANNYLKRLRDFAEVEKDPGSALFAEKILWEEFGVDCLGLLKMDRQYLRILYNQPTGMGVDAIATELNEEVSTVEEVVEPFLISQGLVERRRNGRWITEAGMKHLEDPELNV